MLKKRSEIDDDEKEKEENKLDGDAEIEVYTEVEVTKARDPEKLQEEFRRKYNLNI